jgi:hypothetical protein
MAHAGYECLLNVVRELERSGMHVPEVVTAGTPTFPCALSYEGFRRGGFIHRVSPGTVVYCDATSLAQLPSDSRQWLSNREKLQNLIPHWPRSL